MLADRQGRETYQKGILGLAELDQQLGLLDEHSVRVGDLAKVPREEADGCRGLPEMVLHVGHNGRYLRLLVQELEEEVHTLRTCVGVGGMRE